MAWNGKTLNCASWNGDLEETAAAMQAVSGVQWKAAKAVLSSPVASLTVLTTVLRTTPVSRQTLCKADGEGAEEGRW